MVKLLHMSDTPPRIVVNSRHPIFSKTPDLLKKLTFNRYLELPRTEESALRHGDQLIMRKMGCVFKQHNQKLIGIALMVFEAERAFTKRPHKYWKNSIILPTLLPVYGVSPTTPNEKGDFYLLQPTTIVHDDHTIADIDDAATRAALETAVQLLQLTVTDTGEQHINSNLRRCMNTNLNWATDHIRVTSALITA